MKKVFFNDHVPFILKLLLFKWTSKVKSPTSTTCLANYFVILLLMALLPSSSSSTRGRGFNYGVFLSCGTEDTLEFTGLLYQALCNRGIRTFTDCEVVDEITPALEEAIQTSRIAIVVLSKNYASSSFCLDKLSKILDHFNSKVHPVFYQVDPDDVQMLRGTYGEAIAMHKKRFNDRIQKWTMALQQVSNLPGWQFGLGYPSFLISNILISSSYSYIKQFNCN